MIKPWRMVALLLLATTTTTAAASAAGPASGNLPTQWTGTWATAHTAAGPDDVSGSFAGFTNQSVRMLVRTSVGGEKLRIRITNAYGGQDLSVGHASVGVPVAPGSADLAGFGAGADLRRQRVGNGPQGS